MAKSAVNFTLRLPSPLHACCTRMAKEDGRSMQMWIQRHLEQIVGQEAITVAAYAELSGKTPKKFPPPARKIA